MREAYMKTEGDAPFAPDSDSENEMDL